MTKDFLQDLKDTCELLLNPKVDGVIVTNSDVREIFENKEFKYGLRTERFVVDGLTVRIETETEDIGTYW